MVFLRYLDVCLVLATAPIVLAGGGPALGYGLGAGAWILTRAGVAFVHDRARRAGDSRVRAGLHVAGMLGRVWLVAAAIILARYDGSKADGVMAAALLLAAFTVYLVMSFITRDSPLSGRPAQGTPRTS